MSLFALDSFTARSLFSSSYPKTAVLFLDGFVSVCACSRKVVRQSINGRILMRFICNTVTIRLSPYEHSYDTRSVGHRSLCVHFCLSNLLTSFCVLILRNTAFRRFLR